MELNNSKLWTKNFIIISLVHFFIALNFYLLMIIISEFAMNKFAAPPSKAGFAAGIFVLGALIARLFTGKRIARIGQKKTLYAGLILGLITTSMYFGANNLVLLLVIRFLHGISFGIASTAAGTIAANIIPGGRYGEGIGYFSLSVTLATAIGPFLGIFIMEHGSYSTIFTYCTFLAGINLLIALNLKVNDIRLTSEQLEELKGFKINNILETRVIPISIVCMIIFFCYSSVISFLTVYSKEINLMEAASFFYIIFAVAIFFSRLFIGRLFDAKGENLIMYSAILIFMIGILIFSRAHDGFALLLAAAVIGLGYGSIQSSGQAIAVKITEMHRVGLATSTYFVLGDIGMGIGPFVCGLVIPFTGYRGMYMGVAGVLALCILVYYLLHGNKAKAFKKSFNYGTNGVEFSSEE